MFMNDLDVIDAENIVFTHSSTRWERREFILAMFESAADGRLVKLHLPTGKLTTLIDHLLIDSCAKLDIEFPHFINVKKTTLKAFLTHAFMSFANGVAVSDDKSHLFVAECTRAKVWR
jgi:sugar lactone lactonase YvrE